MILVSPSFSLTGVSSAGSSTDRGVASWNGTDGSTLRSSATVLISSANTLDLSGADLRFIDNTYNIGVTKSQSSGTDYRPNNGFFKGTLQVGNILNNNPPYGLNNSLLAGIIGAGNSLANVTAIIGASSIFNSTAQGFIGFTKDGGFANVPAFVNLNASATDKDVYFSTLHLSSAKTDLLKFGGSGDFTFMKSSGANLLWATDGAGAIGALAGVNRPEAAYVKTLIRLGDNASVLDYGPEGWAPDCALEMSKSDSAFSGYLTASTNQIRLGVYGASDNNFLYWDSNNPGEIQIRNTLAAQTNSWLSLDGSSSGGVDTQAIRFLHEGRLIWNVDGAGDIGSLDGGVTSKRPGNIFVKTDVVAGGKLRAVGGLGVGNSATASVAVGTLAKKIEVFDETGSSLGFVPVYTSIT